jgi:hypothetical protein
VSGRSVSPGGFTAPPNPLELAGSFAISLRPGLLGRKIKRKPFRNCGVVKISHTVNGTSLLTSMGVASGKSPYLHPRARAEVA